MKTLGRLGLGLVLAGSLLLSSSTALAASGSPKIALNGVSGTVAVQGGSTPKSATVGTELATGDKIKTGKASTADVATDVENRRVSTVQVWASSTYTVGQSTVGENGVVKAAATLDEGAVSGSFNARAAGSELTIGTPKVSAAVQDASTFLIQSAGNVYCYTGSIRVTAGGSTYTVLPGQAYLAATGTLVPHNLPAPLALVSAPVIQVTTPTSPTSPTGK